MIRSVIKTHNVRTGYGSATSGAYYWDSQQTCLVGRGSGESVENHARVVFRYPRNAVSGGKVLSISSVTLRLYSVSDVSRTINAEFSSMSDWNVPNDGVVSVPVVGNSSVDVAIDRNDYPDIYRVMEEGQNDRYDIYVHLKASDEPRVTLTGTYAENPAELILVWDYAENTIHTDTVTAQADHNTVHFTVTPKEDDARYVLTYQLGSVTGTAADVSRGSGSTTTLSWMPSATVLGPAMPDSSEAPVSITLTVYDDNGAVLRTENTSVLVSIPGTYVPTVTDMGLVYEKQIADTYNLLDVTEASVAPVVNMLNSAGSPIASLELMAFTANPVVLKWSANELTDNGDGTYTAARKSLGALTEETYWINLNAINARGTMGSRTTILTVYPYSYPSISLFSAERYGEIYDDDQQVIGYQTDPTGNHVWFSAAAAIASVEGANVMTWALTLTSRADGTVLTASGTATGTSLTWSDDRTLIGDTIDPEIVWDATLTVTDSAGFTATAYDVVPAGKAVLHLPACKNGIAFGGLSTATADHPLGEMFYPFYAYAGIHGVTGWSLKEEDTGGVWLDGQKVYRKTLYARIATAGQAVDIPFPDGLQRIVHMQGILYTDDTINRTRPLSWYYNASLNASLWHSGSANVTVQANGEIGDAFVTIWYTKTAGIVITQQPEDATVALGGTATFNVSALGSPTYQWQQSVVAATVGPAASVHVVDALAEPVDALTVDVTLTQDGSGDPSPSNVRTISEQTAAQIFVDRDGTSTEPVASIAFDRAVTGGTLNALTGAMTITKQMDTYDGSSDETWEKMSNVGSRRYFRGRLSGQFQDANRRGTTGVTCNWLPVKAQSQDQTYTLSSMRLTTYTYTSNYIFVLLGTDLPDITTVALLREYLAEHPLQISYPLWTPEAVTLTAVTVSTLAGENTVRTDCGDVTMTYRCAESWSDISGETANALSVTASLEAAQRQYRCALTEGSAEAVSDAAGIVIQ